jgi:CRISPR-associated protein Csm5
MEKPLKIKLHIISPVHIGCDDVYEPTSFIVHEPKKKLIEFDPMDFIKSLTPQERQRFTNICMQGNLSSIVSIYKFISGRQVKGREVEIASGLIPHYKKVKDIPLHDEKRIKRELNQFSISRTAHHPSKNMPYIPGSSLKGAMRTAYLSKLAREQNLTYYWNKYLQNNEGITEQKTYDFISKKKVAKRLEKDLLEGDFETDPFRMVKVSDLIPVGEAKTKIIYAVNKKKKRSNYEARGPFQILETIKEGTVFEGIINIQQPESIAKINKPIQTGTFLKSLNDFYIPQVNKENKLIKEINAQPVVIKRIKEKFKDRLGRTAFLIRIGRHSGAEAVTIEENRYIKIMQARREPPKFSDHATTIWLASETSKPATNSQLIPFGWSIMEIIP